MAFILAALLFLSQMPNLAGTWTLDAGRSSVTPAAPLYGLIPAGAAETLHITHAANDTIILESRINESHSRIYKPGAKTSTPVQGGAITMTSRWEGTSLVSEGAHDAVSGGSTPVREAFALSSDRATLTVEVVTTPPAGRQVSTLIYTRKRVVEPCRDWPTPCKTSR